MKPRDLFGVLVRFAGLGFIIFAMFDFYYVVVKSLGLSTASRVPIGEDIRGTMFYLVLGLILLLGAKLVVRLVYGPDAPD